MVKLHRHDLAFTVAVEAFAPWTEESNLGRRIPLCNINREIFIYGLRKLPLHSIQNSVLIAPQLNRIWSHNARALDDWTAWTASNPRAKIFTNTLFFFL